MYHVENGEKEEYACKFFINRYSGDPIVDILESWRMRIVSNISFASKHWSLAIIFSSPVVDSKLSMILLFCLLLRICKAY